MANGGSFATAILQSLVFIPKSLQRTPWPTKRSLASNEMATGAVIMRTAAEEAAVAAGLPVETPVLRRRDRRQKRACCLASWALYMQMGRCRVRHLSYYAPTLRRTGDGGQRWREELGGESQDWIDEGGAVLLFLVYTCLPWYMLSTTTLDASPPQVVVVSIRRSTKGRMAHLK